MSNSAQHKKMASLPVNESFIEKSIISELPESPQDQENVDDLQSQISRLRQQLQFYRKQAFSKPKTEPFSFRDIEKITANGENMSQANEIDSLRLENEEQKRIIRQISEQLRNKKKSMGGDFAAEKERMEYINQKLQSENTRIIMENQQLKKELQEARMRKSELGRSNNQLEDYKRKNMEQQAKIEEMAETALQQTMQINALTHQLEKLRRENAIDRNARKSSEHLRVIDRHNSRYSINTQNSRAFSQLDLLDNERLNIIISQKNKEYEQLYLKYQSLENQYHAVQQINNDLERQRKFLAERLSDIEIHTEGDEIVGELENKLVLMSTELMRLGNLSRTKTQESKELNLRIKELILKRENLEKDVIQRDKLILNYKEEIRLIEMRHSERNIMESRVEKDSQFKEKNMKLMKEVERMSNLIKEKSEALKNSDIKNAILQEKNMRLEKENEELEKQNKQLSIIRKESKSIQTKALNLQAEVNYYKEANSGLKDEMKRFQSKFYDNRSDIESLTREKELLRQNNLDLQQRVRNSQEEMRRMQLEVDEKSMELRQISHKSEEKVMLKTNQIRKLQEKVMILEKEVQRSSKSKSQAMKYEELVKEIQRLEGVQLAMRMQINTYQENLALLAQQNERLTQIVKQSQQDKALADKFKQEKEQKDRKIKDLQKELENINARQKRQKQENENLREKLRGALVQERESESWQFKNRQLRDQIDVLKSQISNKEDEIRSVNDRLMKERNQRFALQRKNEELSRMGNNRAGDYGLEHNRSQQSTEVKHLNNEIKLKEEMIQSLQEEVNKKDEIHSLLSAEVERLNKALQKNVKEVMNYKKEVDFLQHKVRTCEESLNQRNITQIASQKSIAQAESKTKIDICEGKIRNYEGQLELMRQRYENLKKDFSSQQLKLTQSLNEKYLIQQRANELEYQLNEKSSNFRHVEDSFKLTIMEIKKSNERLEQSLKQIENHYISKLQMKQRECEEVNRQKKSIVSEYYELQKKYTSIEIQYGSQLKEKNMFINNLNTNHNQTKEEIAEIRRIKNEYEVKITLLSQQLERLNELRDKQRIEIERLHEERRLNESQLTNNMKEGMGNQQTFDLLSSEIQRLNSVLVGNVEKIKEYTKKSSKLQMENGQLSRELEEANSRNKEHEKYMNEERQSFNDRIQKLQELNKELKYQLQEKTKDADRFLQRMKLLQKKEQAETNQYMRTVAEEMKLLREGNQKLQSKLGLITRQYEQLVTQLEYYKRPKSSEGDEKMRIIGNYQATIKHMKEENSFLSAEKARIQAELDKLTKISHQLQERGKISQEKARVFEEKCRRLDERCRVLEERSRSSDDYLKGSNGQKQQIEQKLLAALQEIGRLQSIIKAKEIEHQKLVNLINNSKATHNQDYYNENMRDKKGIFVIKEANEVDERSRSASGNGMPPPVRQPSNPHSNDLQYRYQLMESINKKLSSECECLRKKNVEYQFKMSKLKEEFDLINRLIHEYRQENDKLKENNKLLHLQRGNHFMSSQFSSPQHSSIKSSSHISLSPQHNPLREREETLVARSKLAEEIDRLNRINNSLQSEIHDLRLSSTDGISLRKRHEENLALMVLLFTEVESLRMRVRQSEKGSVTSPRKA